MYSATTNAVSRMQSVQCAYACFDEDRESTRSGTINVFPDRVANNSLGFVAIYSGTPS